MIVEVSLKEMAFINIFNAIRHLNANLQIFCFFSDKKLSVQPDFRKV